VKWLRVSVFVLLEMSGGQPVVRAKGHEFAAAKLIDVRKVPAGTEYVILNERCRLTGLLNRTKNLPHIQVGDRIGYATDNKYLYLRDRNGATHKLRYTLQELMPPSLLPIPLSVAEAVDDALSYANRLVTVTGLLSVGLEVTAVRGTGCDERINALKKPYACAVSLRLPDCAKPGTSCDPSLAELSNKIRALRLGSGTAEVRAAVTGILQIPEKVFVEFIPPPAVPGLPKGEYVENGFGHMNAFPVQLNVTYARLMPAER
jgi:hypothetical protein